MKKTVDVLARLNKLLCSWAAVALLFRASTCRADGQACSREHEYGESEESESELLCPTGLKDIDSLLNGSKARNCHRWRFNDTRTRIKLTLGVLFPIYNLNASENKCSNFNKDRGAILGVQLVEALRFAVREGLDRRHRLKELLGAVEIRDTCFSPRFCVEQAVSLAVSSPQAAGYCRANWSHGFEIPTDNTEPDADYISSCSATERVPVIIGPALSRTTKVVAPTLSIFQVPHITYWASSAAFSQKIDYPYLFRTVPSDYYQAWAMVSLLERFNWTYVIALSSNDEISGGLGLDAFRTAMADQQARGKTMCIAFEERFHYSDEIKIGQIVNRLVAEENSKANAVMLFAGREYAQRLFTKMELEYMSKCSGGRNSSDALCAQMDKKNFVWIASDGWITQGPDFIYKKGLREAKMGGKHTLLGFVFKVPNNFSAEADDFANRMRERFKNIPVTDQNLEYNPWLGLMAGCQNRPCANAVNLLQQREVAIPPVESGSLWLAVQAALSMIESAFDRDDWCKRSGEFLRGVMQNVTVPCNRNNNATKACTVFQNIRSEKHFQDLEPGYIIKNAVWDSSSSVNVNTSGRVVLKTVGEWTFNPDGDNDTFGKLELYTDAINISWAAGDLLDVPLSVCATPCKPGQHKKKSTYGADGTPRSSRCCWQCEDCKDGDRYSPDPEKECKQCNPGSRPNANYTDCEAIPPEYIGYHASAAVAIVALAAVGMFVVLATALIFHLYRATQVVYCTGRASNNLLLLALFIGFTSCTIFFNRPSSTWCSMMPVLASGVIIFSTLTVLVRVLSLAKPLPLQQRCMSCINIIAFRGQLIFISIATAIPVLIFMAWVSIDPIETHLYVSDRTSVFIQCERKWAYSGVVAFTLAAVIAATAIMAFRTRKLPSDYNEAKLLLFTSFALCVLWIALTPTIFVTDRVLEPVIISLTILAHTLAIWFCLFLPRLYIIILRPQRNPLVVLSSNFGQGLEGPGNGPKLSVGSFFDKSETNSKVNRGGNRRHFSSATSFRSSDSMCSGFGDDTDGKLVVTQRETSL